MRFGLTVPNLHEYADASLLADLAAEAEAAGWDGGGRRHVVARGHQLEAGAPARASGPHRRRPALAVAASRDGRVTSVCTLVVTSAG